MNVSLSLIPEDTREDYEINREELDKLHKEAGIKFHGVQYLGQKWQIYPDDFKDYPFAIVNHREVLPHELVIDFDLKDPSKLEHYYKITIAKLKKNWKVAFKSYRTGGKGIHIHIFFPEILTIPVEDRPLLKEALTDHLFTTSTGKRYAHHAKIDYQLCTRHLVRCEGGEHEKTGKIKTILDDFAPRFGATNKIPGKALKLFELKKHSPKPLRPLNFTTIERNDIKFKAIDYMLSQDFGSLKAGRKRALNILCSHFYFTQGDKGVDVIIEWDDYKLNRYFGEIRVRRTFESVKRMVEDGRKFGLRSIQNLMKELGVSPAKYMD